MPTETHKFKGRVVELIERFNFKDACRIRPANGGREMIISFAELQPHRTREQHLQERKKQRETSYEKLLLDVIEAIKKGRRSIVGIYNRIPHVGKRAVSRAVRVLEKRGVIVWDRSKQYNIKLSETK